MSDNMRVDLNQSLMNRLIERYGPSAGRKIAEAIQECIAEGHRGTELKKCIKGRIQDLIDAKKVTDENLDSMISLMGHWESVG